MSQDQVEHDLLDVATANGLSRSEARSTIRSGMQSGVKKPRVLPTSQAEARKEKATVGKSTKRTITSDVSSAERSEKRSTPTDDEVGRALRDLWIGRVAFFQDRWYRLQNGFWQLVHSIDKEIWDFIATFRKEDVRPTLNRVRSIEA